LPPADWVTLTDLTLATFDRPFDEWVTLAQGGDAVGTYDAAAGIVTLDLPLLLTDSNGSEFPFTVTLTTELSGTTPGLRLDPLTGSLRLVADVLVPAGGTIVDNKPLLLSVDGVIGPGDEDLDGVQDFGDNCAWDSNTDQADADADGVGDVCDAEAQAATAPGHGSGRGAPAEHHLDLPRLRHAGDDDRRGPRAGRVPLRPGRLPRARRGARRRGPRDGANAVGAGGRPGRQRAHRAAAHHAALRLIG
jgi:hypothetical protein